MTESIKKPIKSKTAQLRAAYRKHQKRLAFWQPLPAVLFAFAVFGGGAVKAAFDAQKGVFFSSVVLLFAWLSWLHVRHLKNDKSIVPFDDIPHAAGGVCPDCGGHLAFAIDEKALKRKNFTAHLVAWVFPFAPIINIVLFCIINPKEISDVFMFAPLLLILMLPFAVALDRLNLPRFAVCRACGFDEPVGFDLATTQRNVALKFIEKFWLPVFRFKWRIFGAFVAIMVAFVLMTFIFPLAFDDPPKNAFFMFMGFAYLACFIAFVGTCNVKFYESYFDVPAKPSDKKPEEKPATPSDAANIDHATPAPNI